MAESFAIKHPVDPILTQILFESVQGDDEMIQDDLLPPQDVSASGRTGTLMIENARNFMGSPETSDLRAPASSRNPITNHDRINATYTCLIRSFRDKIPMEDIEDSQYPGDEEERMSRKVFRSLRIKRERRVADFFGSGVPAWTTVAAAAIPGGGGLQWNVANSTPLVDLHISYDTVRGTSHGRRPSDLLLAYDAFRAFGRNTEVRGYAGAVAAGFGSGDRVLDASETSAAVIRSVGIQRLQVGGMRREGAVKGAASAEVDMYTDFAWIGTLAASIVVNRSGVRVDPTAAVSFRSKGWISGQFDEQDMTARHVWVEHVTVNVAIDTNLGLRITNVLL